MRELSDLMADAVDARELSMTGLAPTPDARTRTLRRVRNRRLVRHSAETTFTVAAVAGLATAGWLGARSTQAPPPAQSPSPTVETPSPSPSVTDEPAPVSFPGLPPVLPVPDGLLSATTPGWVLTTYRPVAGDDAVAGQYVVLVSPDGERYLAADLSTAGAVRILSWRAGATTARVLVDETPASLDLVAGTLTADPRTTPAGAVYVATVADGSEVWMTPVDGPEPPDTYLLPTDGGAFQIGSLGSTTSRVSVSPDGRFIASDTAAEDAVVVVDASTGTRSVIDYGVSGGQCSTVAWIDATGVLAQCFDYTGGGGPLDWNPRLVRAGLDGSVTVVRQQVQGDPFTAAGAGMYVSDGVVAFAGMPLTPELGTAQLCAADAYLLDGTPLQVGGGSLRLASENGLVYVGATPGCDTATSPTELTLADPGPGTQVVLGPVPPGEGWTAGLSSWVVATG